MDAWYRVVTPRREVREGRSFNPDEFAIALDQVVDGTAPEDYRDPEQFFSRTFFTQALKEHTRHRPATAFRRDREHRPGALPGHPVRRRQDPHPDIPLPPGTGR